MNKTLEDQIKDANLTKTEGIVAEFILENQVRACFMTVADISSELDISDTSVIRFARALGYSGFAQLQKKMQADTEHQIENGSGNQVSPLERLERIIPHITDDNLLESMMDLTAKNFEATFKRNSFDKIEETSKLLIKSRCKYIVGFKGCQALASNMALVLTQTLPGVRPVLYADSSAFEPLLDLSSEDCVMVYSFSRYSRVAETISEYTRQRGAKLVVITDRATAPVANGADVLLVVSCNNLSFNNSHVVTSFLSELISADIIRKLDAKVVEERLKNFDILISPQEFF